MFKETTEFIRSIFADEVIQLHEPRFVGREKELLLECIDSTFVSSVGKFVGLFEEKIKEYTGASHAVACVNGTAALHIALILAGVKREDLVITQPLTFIATCNAIAYTGAEPYFIDIDRETLGLSHEKLSEFLAASTHIGDDGHCYHTLTSKRISACIPMHTFGHPLRIDEVVALCKKYNIPVVEDAAESIGSTFKGLHTGRFGISGTMSFNGNKTITCGGGGMIITDDGDYAAKAKHLTTQAKMPHAWEFNHDHIGYNYRLPNINAALACAQMEKLNDFIENKRQLAEMYRSFFEGTEWKFIVEPKNAHSNYWLNSVLLKDREERDAFLEYTNSRKIMSRPAWTLIYKLPMFRECLKGNTDNAQDIENRLVNLPSSVRI